MRIAASSGVLRFAAIPRLAPYVVLGALLVLAACADGGTRKRPYEEIYITQLSRGPIAFSEFRRGVLAETLSEAAQYDMDNPDAVGPDRCRDSIRGREGSSFFPVVWAPGHSKLSVYEVYSIGIHGAGWGGGDLRGSFEIYVSSDGKVIGWHTNTPEWRARIEPYWQ